MPCTELGIDVGGIVKKSRAILLYRMSSKVIYDLDMGGALLYVFLLGGLHLLVSGILYHFRHHARTRRWLPMKLSVQQPEW
jgi:hypothetical protein